MKFRSPDTGAASQVDDQPAYDPTLSQQLQQEWGGAPCMVAESIVVNSCKVFIVGFHLAKAFPLPDSVPGCIPCV